MILIPLSPLTPLSGGCDGVGVIETRNNPTRKGEIL